MNKMDSAKRVISGTHGKVWLGGELVAECYGMQAKVANNKEDVAICGVMMTDVKVISQKGTGSLKLHKVASTMARLLSGMYKDGKDVRFVIKSMLADPDSYGKEQVAIYNVSFDDLTLADWEAATKGTVEAPFTFTDYEYLDMI